MKKVLMVIMVLCLGLVPLASAGDGELLREFWGDIGGTSINDLLNNANYPDNPTDSSFVTMLDDAGGAADNYGLKISGYIMPPASGDYNFWTAGDDQTFLVLSTDSDPANGVVIARESNWTGYQNFDGDAERASAPIRLYAKRKYYIHGMVKEGGGGDSLSAAWQGPEIPERLIIGAPYVTTIPGALHIAVNPIPADGTTELSYTEDAILSWDAPTNPLPEGASIIRYDVYADTDDITVGEPNGANGLVGSVAGDVTEFTIPAAMLEKNTTYYWRVDTITKEGTSATDPNNGLGNVWMASTVWTKPVITGQPADVAVHPGEEAVFTVEATSSIGGISYQWYNSAGDPVANGTEATLVISAAGDDDADSYYCIATNADGAATSASATLQIKHMLAHYPLDTTDGEPNGIDVSGNGYHGTVLGNVIAVPGMIDGAASFGGANGDYITLGNWNPSEETGMLSISHWVAWDSNGGSTWQGSMGKRDNWAGDDMMWQLELSHNNNGFLELKRNGSDPGGFGYTMPGDLTWVHFVVTFDGVTAETFINGITIGTAGFSFGTDPTSEIMIAACNAGGGNPWHGYIDDVRIYDYRLSWAEVATLYTNVMTDEAICVGNPAMDLSGNCRVGVEDLALFVTGWMECNIVPECKP